MENLKQLNSSLSYGDKDYSKANLITNIPKSQLGIMLSEAKTQRNQLDTMCTQYLGIYNMTAEPHAKQRALNSYNFTRNMYLNYCDIVLLLEVIFKSSRFSIV